MDPLTQVLLGAAVGHVALGPRVGRKALFWGAVLGGAPDLDVFIPQADAVAEVTNHRGFTHSLITHTIVAPIIGAGLARLHRNDGASSLQWAVLAWLALATHALLDAVTIYGTQLFWPLTGPPVGLGSVFIIDPLYTLLLLVGVLSAAFARRNPGTGRRALKFLLGAATAYLAGGILIQAQVLGIAEQELTRQNVNHERMFATPTPFNLLLWRVVAMTPEGYREGYYSLLDSSPRIQFQAFPSANDLLADIKDAPAVERLRWFNKGFYRVREEEGRIEMTDLRMGYEPRYVFSFFVGQRIDKNIRPLLPPERVPAQRPDAAALEWVWQRMLGKVTEDP